jgi:hypothetical protein
MIAKEVSYWAELGKQQGGGALESVFYPLAAIKLRDHYPRTPFDPIDLTNVAHFAIGGVFLPPRGFANYSSYAAGFQAKDPEQAVRMQQVFRSGVAAINRFYPRLLFLGPGHSHPFAVSDTAPSSTDITHHILPYHKKNTEWLGCRFSLALIVVQTADRQGWQACAFATDHREHVHRLGVAEVITTQHPAIKDAWATPFYHTRRGRKWEQQQKSLLGDKLLEHARWPGGWTSFLIKEEETMAQLVMLPPGFPLQTPLKQQVCLESRLPGEVLHWQAGRAYKNYVLGGSNVC